MAYQAEAFLQAPLIWQAEPLLDSFISQFKPLMQRLETTQIDAMLAASAEEIAAAQTNNKANTTNTTQQNTLNLKETIDHDTFAKVDLRIAEIVKAETVEGADKLLKLSIKLDANTAVQTIFAGIKTAYPDPKVLEGKLTVVVANLAPRKMRFGISEGMVLAAGPGGEDIYLLSPDAGATMGMKVK